MKDNFLPMFMVLLAVIELGLIFALYKVRLSMMDLNINLKELSQIRGDIVVIKRRLNNFFQEMLKINGSQVTVKGETKTLGKVDLKVKISP